jgi:hypothetical protein
MARRLTQPLGDGPSWWCPGCGITHRVDGRWSYNGDHECPTISPSVLTRWPALENVCHCFIRDGRIEFLNDCTHDLAGQTVPMVCPACHGDGCVYGIEGEGETVMPCPMCSLGEVAS